MVARTERGRRIVEAAMEAGHLVLDPIGPWALPASQPGSEASRGKVWGRLLALRLAGVAVPRYERMPMFRYWLSLLSLVDGSWVAAVVWVEVVLGVAWFVLGRRELLRPAGLAVELGAVMALVCLALSTLALESLGALRPEVG